MPIQYGWRCKEFYQRDLERGIGELGWIGEMFVFSKIGLGF